MMTICIHVVETIIGPLWLPAEATSQLLINEGGGGGLSTFTGWSSRTGWAVAIVLTGVTAAALAMILLLYRRWDRAHHRPTWRRLARALQLTRAERRLVLAMARAVGPVHPVSVLISEGTFESATKYRMGRYGDPRLVEGLRRRVFGRS